MDIGSILRNHGIDIAKVGGDGGTVNTTILPTALQTTTDNQKVWDIPQGRFDNESDSMIVFHNTVYLEPTSYTLTGDAATGYTLTIPDAPDVTKEDNNVNILVFKNFAEVGSLISGTQLTDGSIALSKLGQDIQDFIKNGQAEIVDNLTTADKTKVLSASQGVVIKEELDKTLKNNFFNKDNMYFNLNNTFAVKQFNSHVFENDTTSELCEVVIPLSLTVTGIFKFTMVSSYANSDATGGAEILFHVGATEQGRLYHQTVDIVSMTTTFADNFYIKDAIVDTNYIKFGIIKRQRKNHLSVQMSYQTVIGNAWNVIANANVYNYPMSNVITLTEYPKQYSIAQSTPRTTNRNMDIFVSSETGSDVSGIGTKGKPYRTIQFAIDKLPQIIDHSITVYLEEGFYSESAVINGKVGRGRLNITSVNTGNRRATNISRVYVLNCQVKIGMYYLSLTGSSEGLVIDNCHYITVTGVDMYGAGSIGLYPKSSTVFLNSSGIWDKKTAVYADELSRVLLNSIVGKSNTNGITSAYGAEVIKSSVSMTSTNGDSQTTGGIIR
ncbi:hypothetical protein [Lysinibacillus sp. NPDC086135]|uniref:hypothetical protein n=1 Tax=Lysinibacillus sp. NPDC086135 TaxID=3364130 RepID=UPI003818CEEB